MTAEVCVILAGGLGTRLAPVLTGLPKCLAPVGGRSFLALQIASLAERGVQRFVLALGHLAPLVEQAVEPLRATHDITCIVEPAALGTGGALWNAIRAGGVDECLATNGDTWLDAPLDGLLAPLDLARGERLRLGSAEVPDAGRYGGLVVESNARVSGFVEKGVQGPGVINAGLFRVHGSAFDGFEAGSAFSLERDVLPSLALAGSLTAVPLPGGFIDIGIPEDLQRFRDLHAVAHG
jgi:D-glycero-alpha-D-manno-heptose 1-phosphate guanylyltransferase